MSKQASKKRTSIRIMITRDTRREVREFWKIIKAKLSKHYDINEKFVSLSDKLTPTDICKKVKSEGYAAAIHDFSPMVNLLPYVVFTHPILLNENVLYIRRDRYRTLRTAMNMFFFQYLLNLNLNL